MSKIAWDYDQDRQHEIGIDENGKVWQLIADEIVEDRHCAMITDGKIIALVINRMIVFSN